MTPKITCTMIRKTSHFVFAIFTIFALAGIAPRVSAANNPVPLINQPTIPVSIAPGGAAFTLTVNGTGFVANSVVHWNNGPRSTHFVSASQLTATITAHDIATANTGAVSVVSPGPGGGTSNVVFFPVAPLVASPVAQRADFPSGSAETADIKTADFNGDGKLDLVVTNYDPSTPTVSVLLGNGNGSFQPPIPLQVGSYPYGVTVADFNGDGKADIAVTVPNTNSVAVLLGNGDGTFQNAVQYPVGQFPFLIVNADFNADGIPDLAVANGNSGTVSILLGNGNGTFQPAASVAVGSTPYGLAVGDFNGDGALDLAVSDSGGKAVSILLGNGNGTFMPQVQYPVDKFPYGLSAVDVNGDGILDLAVPEYDAHAVAIFIGNGDGTFQPQYSVNSVMYPTSAVPGDFNADGIVDLIVGSGNTSNVGVLLGKGDGTFQPPLLFRTDFRPTSAIVADFNDDGRLDIAAAITNSNNISVIVQGGFQVLPKDLNIPITVIGQQSKPVEVTLSNVGYLPVSLSSISIDNAAFTLTNNCPSTIAVGAKCTVSIVFQPQTVGLTGATLTVTDSFPTSPQTVRILATGTHLTLAPQHLGFGPVKVGNPSPSQNLTLTNTGANSVDIAIIHILGKDPNDFSYGGTCFGTLASGASCTISVTFTPTALGPREAVIRVTSAHGEGLQQASVSGTGT